MEDAFNSGYGSSHTDPAGGRIPLYGAARWIVSGLVLLVLAIRMVLNWSNRLGPTLVEFSRCNQSRVVT